MAEMMTGEQGKAAELQIKVKVSDDETEHKLAMSYYVEWREATLSTGEREDSMRDIRYYHGAQWSDEEIADLEDRGQPPVVINMIHRKVNHARGNEVRTRVDPTAAPRTPQHEQGAAAMADAIRYVADKEDFDERRGDLAEGLLIPGITGMLVGVKPSPSGRPEIYLRQIDYDRLWWDPRATRHDFSDARYLGYVTWMSEDQLTERYGAEYAKEAIDASKGEELDDVTHQDKPVEWYSSDDKRVLVVDAFYRRSGVWIQCTFTAAGFVGKEYRPRPVPYVDDCVEPQPVCPLQMAAAFRDDKNRHYGIVRHMISPQDEVNKRRSKLLHYLAVHQFLYEEGAVDSVEGLKHQLARPDGAGRLNSGALRDGRIQMLNHSDRAAGQMQMLQLAMQELQVVGASTEGIIGSDASGRSVLAQQNLANIEMEPVFSRLRSLQMRVFTHIWYRVRQYWTTEMWLRVRDDPDRTGYRFVGINRPTTKGARFYELVKESVPIPSALAAVGVPRDQAEQLVMQSMQVVQVQAQQMGVQLDEKSMQEALVAGFLRLPQAREPFVANDVEQIHVDIELDVAPDTTVLRQEQFATLAQLAQAYPQAIPPEVIIEMSELRPEVKRRIREHIEQSQQQNPAAQAAAQLELQKRQADIQRAASQSQLDQARAQKTMVETQLSLPAAAQRDQAAALSDAVKSGAAMASPVGLNGQMPI